MGMRIKGGKHPLVYAALLQLLPCLAPFLLLPLLLPPLSMEALQVALFLLVYPACPLLALLTPYRAVRRGLPAIAAACPPPLCYLLLWVHGIVPVGAVVLISALLSLLSASAGQQVAQQKQRNRKGGK